MVEKIEQHTVKVIDASYIVGYGPNGHGTWKVLCSCGWTKYTSYGGKNYADMVARDHTGHSLGQHTRPVYDCAQCR